MANLKLFIQSSNYRTCNNGESGVNIIVHKFSLLLILLLCQLIASAQQRDNNNQGNTNASDLLVVPCQFETLIFSEYSEGLQKVRNSNGLEGFVNKTGKVIPCQWKSAGDFCEGLAPVRGTNGLYGYIDKTGELVIPCQWNFAGNFEEGVAMVRIRDNSISSLYGFIDKTGREVIPCKWKTVNKFSEGKVCVRNSNWLYGFIDKTGKEVIPCQWESAGDFHEGLARVNAGGIIGGQWGFIDKSGKLVIPYQWKSTYDFHEGIAKVLDKNDLYGLIDKTGKLITPCKWQDIREFEEGLAPVEDANERWGFIDKTGNLVIPCQWKDAKGFSDGLAPVLNSNDLYGFIDKSGKLVFPCQWENVGYFYDDIWTLTDSKGLTGFIDLKNKVVISPCKWKDVAYTHTPDDNLLAVMDSNDLWGFIDKTGKEVVPCQWLNYYCYSEDLLGVKKTNGLWGFIDKTGNLVIPYQWKSVDDFHEGLAGVQGPNDLWGFIDKTGKLVIPCQWESVISENLPEGLAAVKDSNGLWGFIKKPQINNEPNYASISWQSFEPITKDKDYQLKIGIKSDSKIEDVTITVNGTQERGIKTIQSDGYDMTIDRMLTLNEGTNMINISVRNEAGMAQDEKTIVYRPQGGNLPKIEWLDFAVTANKKEYQMKLGIKSKSKVEEVNVTVNGAQSRGIKTIQTDGYDLTVDRTLALSEGVNRIVVSVRNGDGIATSEKVITCQGINPTPIFNDKRIAFVVGNSHYSNSEMNLTNPENDAKDVAEKLKELGFEVVLKLDATLETMDKELSSFKEKAKDYDVAMFYYAGHGIQNKGVNYIIPTNIENLAEDNLKYKCVNMERVLDVMEDSQCKLKIVILDACRNDPVSRKWHRSAGTRGLSIMNAPTGTIISFSTSPGSTALDGTGRNSPYTQAFLNTLDMPNLDVFHFFQKVGASVLDMTQKAQNPWLSVSFTGDFYFNKQ